MRIEVQVEQVEPIAGWLRSEHGSVRRFAGWLDLLAAISDLTAVRPDGPSRSPTL